MLRVDSLLSVKCDWFLIGKRTLFYRIEILESVTDLLIKVKKVIALE